MQRQLQPSMMTGNQTQRALGLDDGSGLRVAQVSFQGAEKFDWSLFRGYQEIRVLTYSASIKTIIRMLDDFSFEKFECIFGCENVLNGMAGILAFQQIVLGDTRAAIMGLRDERHARILEKVHSGQARFRVLREETSHSKIYLLSNPGGKHRVMVGSANLSEAAFEGRQSETLLLFDNDEEAWKHYSGMVDEIRDRASSEIEIPEERITTAEVKIAETPVLSEGNPILVIEPQKTEPEEVRVPVQAERIEKLARVVEKSIPNSVAPVKGGKITITPEVRTQVNRIQLAKSEDGTSETRRLFTMDRANRTANLSGEEFPLDYEEDLVGQDARIILEYFRNYEGTFEGNVPALQRDYFTLMSWLYFSPFICELRTRALSMDEDVIRYPLFAIMFGKSNCGKTRLVETLTLSMFGMTPDVDKTSFTKAKIRALQHAYQRLPVVFDDIGNRAFQTHGKDAIKEDTHPGLAEYPSFVLSMNADPQSFPDEIVKRSLMVHTTTALPSHNELLRQELQKKIQEIRKGLTGHFYRKYLTMVMDRLDQEELPNDWLELSAGIINEILQEVSGEPPPEWRKDITWLKYAEKRYDRVKARIRTLLRKPAYQKREGSVENGWTMDDEQIIVWESQDAFGRSKFSWDDVPSTLIDQEATSPGRTVMHRPNLEEFLGERVKRPGSFPRWFG